VAYRFAVAAVVTGVFSLSNGIFQFFLVAMGGILVGLVVGSITAWFHWRVDDPPVEITVSLLTPFVAYIGAERFHVSGVLAVVTAGLYLGWRTPEITTFNMRLQAGPFWNMIEFLLNGFVFILIGFELPVAVGAIEGRSVWQLIGYALGISAAVIIIRVLWIFPATYLPRLLFRKVRFNEPHPKWQHVMIVAWTGMRGVVSLAAAMALPLTTSSGAPFPGRDLILLLTFVVILSTLVVQGLSLPVLIRWLGIEDDNADAAEEHMARLRANRAALDKLEKTGAGHPELAEPVSRLIAEYKARIRHLESPGSKESNGWHGLFSSDYETLSEETLNIERDTILQLRNESEINDEVLRRIQRDIDLAEARLRHNE
jgi:CPA1 family monovalent cation:H+ antiporter